jgi:hypothetical protein
MEECKRSHCRNWKTFLVWSMGKKRTSNSKNIMVQQHDGRMSATVRPTTAETLTSETLASGQAQGPATAWTRTREWTSVKVGSSTEETPARAWVPATSC